MRGTKMRRLASTYIFLKLLCPECFSLSLLPFFDHSLLVIHSPGPGQMVLGLVQVFCTLARLVSGKANVKPHLVSLLTQVHKEPNIEVQLDTC